MTHRQFLFTHAARASTRYAESAHTLVNRGSDLPTRRNTSMAPSQSVGAAGRTASPQISPRVSTSRCRLRPDTFFPPVVPLRAAAPGRLDALAVDRTGARRLLAVEELADITPEGIVQLLPDPGVPPRVEVVADGLPRREVVRQAPPLAPGPGQVEDRIDDVLAVVDPGPTGSPRRPVAVREEVVDVGPLEVRQVTRVGLPCAHAKRINSTPGHWQAQLLDA